VQDRARVNTLFESKNQARLNALARGDNPTYARLCDELGAVAEDGFAYEKGLAELASTEMDDSELDRMAEVDSRERDAEAKATRQIVRKRVVPNSIYGIFLEEAGRYQTNLFKDTQRKADLLRKYFSRFRSGGKQDLEGYEPAVIGRIFLRNVEYAQRRAKESGQ
jgi:hypothetical protein